MTKNELMNKYFEWMYQLVCDDRRVRRSSYRKLLHHLHSVDFSYIIGMDGNRSEDGVGLRYRFGYERGYEDPLIATCLDDRDCSVLEMLIALANRCEEHIMDDPDIGDRTGEWFWNMITNLGLISMTDIRFDKLYVEDVIRRFLNRQYDPDGRGGLFTIEHCKYDLRNVEIWYQMCWYLDELFYQ